MPESTKVEPLLHYNTEDRILGLNLHSSLFVSADSNIDYEKSFYKFDTKSGIYFHWKRSKMLSDIITVE